jgi:membrane-bound serine protease (ClpP class)
LVKKRTFLWLWSFLLILCLFQPVQPARAQSDGKSVIVLTANGPLTPAMAEYLDRGLRRADQDKAELLVLQLNTPGGSLDLMNRMVQSIRASVVPVVVYVTPRGAMAASAGTLITLAAHAAAMAPETIIGAASPVGGQGEDIGQTEALKIKEAMKALVRSMAERRGPEAVALGEAAIDNAKAASVNEAKKAGLIDFIAADLTDLLRQLDGFVVTTSLGEHRLATSGLSVVPVSASFIEQLLAALTNPNIVFLLLSVGVQALLIELSTPGGWVAGFIGVVCLALAGYGMGILTVNWFGLFFLLIAFVLFILDIKAPTHGALTVAGVVSFIVGALVLFNSPGVPSFQRVSVPLVVGTSLVLAGLFFTVLMVGLRAQRIPVRTDQDTLVNRIGVARTDIAPTGTVQVGSELWTADLAEGETAVQQGSQVAIVSLDGMRLKVRPAAEPKRR